jgi:pyridoxal 5'-phosphate synthase pdxT subunit
MPIGVLALQGDFREHLEVLSICSSQAIPVRTAEELSMCNGLIIPGGESTVIEKLADMYSLTIPIKKAIADGLPVFGTCAGLILLSNEIVDGIPGQNGFGGLDISVRRNAFGNQLDSFEAELAFEGIAGDPVRAAFIRAPIVERVGTGVQVLSRLADETIVAVKSGNILGIAFHPEISGEQRVHRVFLEMVKARKFQPN